MKKTFRKNISAVVCGLSRGERDEFSRRIVDRVEGLDEFRLAQTVAAYWPLPGEVDIRDALRRWCLTKTVLLPVVKGDGLLLKRYDPDATMTAGSFGILEPQGEAHTDYGLIDVLIVPGVGFDRHCGRLGRGKGYYDRLLAGVSGTKIGVCFGCRVTEDLPLDSHDVNMDIVVTETETIRA